MKFCLGQLFCIHLYVSGGIEALGCSDFVFESLSVH